jgi:hypothetical protein
MDKGAEQLRRLVSAGFGGAVACEIVSYHNQPGGSDLDDDGRWDLYVRAAIEHIDTISAFLEETRTLNKRFSGICAEEATAIQTKMNVCCDLFRRFVHTIPPREKQE